MGWIHYPNGSFFVATENVMSGDDYPVPDAGCTALSGQSTSGQSDTAHSGQSTILAAYSVFPQNWASLLVTNKNKGRLTLIFKRCESV